MARVPIYMPKFGMTMTEGTIAEWMRAVGDSVAQGDVLLSVETEKVVTEIECPTSGTLVERLFEAGDEVPVGEIMAFIEE